jgi:hypothetical protein
MDRPIKYIHHHVIPTDTGVTNCFTITSQVKNKVLVFNVDEHVSDERIKAAPNTYIVDSYARCRSAVLSLAKAME